MSKDYIRRYGHEENGEWIRPIAQEGEKYTYHWNPIWAEDPTKPILKISKSSLGCFKWCNKQYEFQYLDRRQQEQTLPMLKGTTVHDSHENFYETVDIKKAEKMDTSQLMDYFSSLFPIDDYVDLTQKMVTHEVGRFIEAKKENTLENFIPVGNEVMFDTDIVILPDTNKNYPLTRPYVVHLQGVIDRIFREGDTLIPLELKTGPWKDTNLSGIRREMAFYTLLLENVSAKEYEEKGLPNLPITHWGWYYPATNHLTIEEKKKSTITALFKSIAQLIYAYENNLPNNFKATFFHKKCIPHCSYNSICPAAINNETEGDWF